jgi:hypothetical protein
MALEILLIFIRIYEHHALFRTDYSVEKPVVKFFFIGLGLDGITNDTAKQEKTVRQVV